MNQILVIVPTVNERENLPRLAQKLLSLPVAVDVLVVDGNSTDGTGQIADELAAKHPAIHVLHEAQKAGLGRAYLAGFKWALERNYEFVFEMDSDFSHDPDEIPNFLKAAQNADLVLGSRYTGGVRVLNWPLKRLLLSRCAGIYVWLVTGMPFTDPTGGYKCFRRRALQAIELNAVKSHDYSFQIEITHRLWRAGFASPKSPSSSPNASPAPPKSPATPSSKPSGWSGGCGCKTGCTAGRARRRARLDCRLGQCPKFRSAAL